MVAKNAKARYRLILFPHTLDCPSIIKIKRQTGTSEVMKDISNASPADAELRDVPSNSLACRLQSAAYDLTTRSPNA